MQPDQFFKQLDAAEQAKKLEQDKAEQIGAVNQSGDKMVSALKDHTGELTSSIHDLLMATMVSKDPRIAETAKNLANLLSEIKNATVSIQGANFKPLADKLGALQETLDAVPGQIAAAHEATNPNPILTDMHETLKSKNFNPTISVKAPTVNTSGLQKVMKDHFDQSNSMLNLDSYRAQDLDEMEPGVQYVGFINPRGAWYIIKNNEEQNTLRYAFGNDSYEKFWPQASKLDYKLLNEALNVQD
jgi:hypothetical protein